MCKHLQNKIRSMDMKEKKQKESIQENDIYSLYFWHFNGRY